jgi:hypothetical protein
MLKILLRRLNNLYLTLENKKLDPVMILVNPSTKGATAKATIFKLPLIAHEKPKLVKQYDLDNMGFEESARTVKSLMTIYDVKKIEVFTVGMGHGLWELITKFFPKAKPLRYSPDSSKLMRYQHSD